MIDPLDFEVAKIAATGAADPPQFPLTEYGNTQRFIDEWGDHIHYCPEAKRWLVWTGARWEWDEDGAVERMAKATVRRINDDALAEQDLHRRRALAAWWIASESEQKICAMIKLATTEAGIIVHVSQLDADDMLFGVTNGVIDLRTGMLRPCMQGDYLTKRGLVEYQPQATCPKWDRFIYEVFGGGAEMIAYFQRVVGYLLTGRTDAQCMFILLGVGANGKTVTTETLKMLIGDYAATIPPDALMVPRNPGGPSPDLARLRGARFVLAAESDDGSVLSASFIKKVTGEETISCRALYGHPFEYRPAFKLFLTTNHKPIIKDDGHGMWRRIHLIEFNVRFEGKDRNPNLKQELLAELPGILNWGIAGCLEWQRQGLNPPDAVTRATQEYRSAMDILGQWIEDCCELDARAVETCAALYQSYARWFDIECGGVRPTPKAFGSKLVERGYTACKTAKGERARCGLRLVSR